MCVNFVSDLRTLPSFGAYPAQEIVAIVFVRVRKDVTEKPSIPDGG
jgi:hypothetical protein